VNHTIRNHAPSTSSFRSHLAIILLGLAACTQAHAADPVASTVCIENKGGFPMEGAIRWGNGQTDYTGNYTNPNTKCFDLVDYFKQGKIAEGASTWAVAAILAGPSNKESSQNVTFSSAANATVTYTITGTTLKSSFQRQ
jgi:hypothetical protein